MNIGNLGIYGMIYKITNLINNKVYIGQTTIGFNKRYNYTGHSAIERVYKYHKYCKDNERYYNSHLLNAIEKYGFDNFKVDKIFDIAFSKEELDIKEQSWILIYDSFKNGYNRCEGGKGSKGKEHTEEWKKNHSKMMTENNPFKGKCHSDETKEYLRKINTGKVIPYETRIKMSESKKGQIPWNLGIKATDEHRKKVSEATTGIKNGNSKKYRVIDLDGNIRMMCGYDIYNNGKNKIGLFNINEVSFKKYILPIGKVDIEYIKSLTNAKNGKTKKMLKNLQPFDGWIVEQL